MANYLTAPAYNTYQVDPYKLPAQQIVEAINTRNQYWDQGASQLKSAYENYLGLDLSLKANQDKLDGLMQGVNTNLKKVVSTDLSLADNVNTAMKIFDPITNDDDIKYDNAITKHYKQQTTFAQSLKTKDGGKHYNDANFGFMMKPLQDFIKSNDPSKAREIYSTRRFYTPYHDVMEEWNKVEKNFKPDTTVFLRPETDANGKLTNSGRMIEEKNKSIYASQFRAYMSAHLSDKAKEQLGINGVMAYGDNVPVLAKDYINYNNEKLVSYTKEIEDLKGKRIAAIKSGQTNQAELYQHDIDRYETEVKKLATTNTKLKIDDFSDLEKNKDNIAGQIYTSNWIDNISKSSARKDIEIKYSKDDTALFFLKMNNDNANANIDRQLDWNIAVLNNQTRLATAEMSASAKKKTDENGNEVIETERTYGIATEDNDETSGKADVDKMLTEGETIKIEAADALNKYLISAGIVDPKKSKAINDAATEEWKKNNPNDYRWKEYREQLDIGDSKVAAAKAIQEFVENEIKKTNPKLVDGSNLKNDKSDYKVVVQTSQDRGALVDAPISLSEKDMLKILNGENVGGFTKKDLKNSDGKIIGTELYYNNKKVPTNFGQNKSIYNLLESVYQKQAPYREASSKLYNQAISRVEGLERFVEKPGQKEGESPTLDKVRTVILNKLGAAGVTPTDVFITHRNRDGGIYFKVDAENDKINGSKIKKIVEQVGGKYKKQFEGGSYYLPNSEVGEFIKPRIFSDSRLAPIQVEVDFKIATKKNNDVFQTTGLKFNDRDFYFRVTNKSGMPFYEVIDEDSEASFINFATGQPFGSLEEASQMANTLSKLSKEDLEAKIRDPKVGNRPDYQINRKKHDGRSLK
jgi:hypothetical protein